MFPIADDANITAANKSTSDGKDTYLVTYKSSKSLKDLYTLYKYALKDSTDISTSESSENYLLAGTKQNLSFYISIYVDESNGKKESAATITISHAD
ncbi:MAG: hypothetical protein ACOY31_00415 [Bacillota bacterium]